MCGVLFEIHTWRHLVPIEKQACTCISRNLTKRKNRPSNNNNNNNNKKDGAIGTHYPVENVRFHLSAVQGKDSHTPKR